jgi:hypothetical protein
MLILLQFFNLPIFSSFINFLKYRNIVPPLCRDVHI